MIDTKAGAYHVRSREKIEMYQYFLILNARMFMCINVISCNSAKTVHVGLSYFQSIAQIIRVRLCACALVRKYSLLFSVFE